MQQGTQEWLDLRRRHIGASDAAVCMGISPWKTQYQLWQEKLGLGEPQVCNEAMKRGTNLEPYARAAFELKTGIKVKPEVLFHPTIPYMMASLDGISEDYDVVEIKVPGKIDHQCAMDGKIPEKYMPQLQHIMEVCQIENMFYFSFNERSDIILQVIKNQGYTDVLLQKEREFWKYVTDLEQPPFEDRDLVKKNDEKWALAVCRYTELQKQLKFVEEKFEFARNELINLTDGKNCKGHGIEVIKSCRRGNIDYKSIPQLIGVDLEIYRKPTGQCWRILQKE